jgi:hypothetical protein
MITILLAMTPVAWPFIWERFVQGQPCWGGDLSHSDVALQTIIALVVTCTLAALWTL